MNKKQLLRKEKGITLVALVITIVILIILATVTINTVFGENGLITKAQQAKDMQEEAMKNEEEGMNDLLQEYISIVGDPTEQEPTKIADVTRNKAFTRTTKVSDASGDILYVPGGFGIATDSADDIDDGIVITNEENTKQFVWIPVSDESLAEMYQTESTEEVSLPVELSKSTLGENATTTSVYSNLRQRSGDSYTITVPGANTGMREPDILTSTNDGDAITGNSIKGIEQIKSVLGISGSTDAEVLKNYAQSLADEYIATYQSIAKYDGFYIGRYEITGSVENPTVQKDEAVITNKNWYELKKACTNVVSTQYAQSTMIYGNQWDEVMSWLKETKFVGDEEKVDSDSSSWGNYNDYNTKNNYEEGNEKYVSEAGRPQTAGFSKYWKANNIYDLAGNCYECTQEAYNTSNRVLRGGSCYYSGSSSPSSDRTNSTPQGISSGLSSRPALYIK